MASDASSMVSDMARIREQAEELQKKIGARKQEKQQEQRQQQKYQQDQLLRPLPMAHVASSSPSPNIVAPNHLQSNQESDSSEKRLQQKSWPMQPAPAAAERTVPSPWRNNPKSGVKHE